MKDLLVFAADADTGAFIGALLDRPEALGIRRVTFDIKRHDRRDPGMVTDGPERARLWKGHYEKALLIWDHEGSGRERKQTPAQAAADIAGRMDDVTWANNHTVVVLEPELEIWLWHCESALRAHLDVSADELLKWIEVFAGRARETPEAVKRDSPKDLFEDIVKVRLKRTISPRDFEHIGRRASIRGLMSCPSFAAIAGALREWFPPEP